MDWEKSTIVVQKDWLHLLPGRQQFSVHWPIDTALLRDARTKAAICVSLLDHRPNYSLLPPTRRRLVNERGEKW
jgi:hypothetical protein